jgi:hypothetical protein
MPTTEDFEGQNPDVTQESSPEPEKSEANAEQPEGQTAAAQNEQVPFHEHPRFRELVEQKNKYADELKQVQSQFSEMQRLMHEMRQPKTQAQEDALHARLKGIDPEFGERFAKVDSSLNELQELKQWKAQMEADNLRNTAISTIEKLHTENKVPAEWRDLYNSQIEAAAMRDRSIGLKDLPNLYKRVHEQVSKLMEGTKRADRESYVTDKKKDASTPSMTKGKAPQKSGPEWSKDPYEARQQLVQRVRAQLKADKEV